MQEFDCEKQKMPPPDAFLAKKAVYPCCNLPKKRSYPIMRYLVVIPDGMADYTCPALDNKTPMEAAKKPTIDALARHSL